jgi:hypothetical protein
VRTALLSCAARRVLRRAFTTAGLTPADVYFGRGESILEERKRIKEKTIQSRRLQHQLETV